MCVEELRVGKGMSVCEITLERQKESQDVNHSVACIQHAMRESRRSLMRQVRGASRREPCHGKTRTITFNRCRILASLLGRHTIR